MADDLGIMLTELPEAESINDNDLLYLVKENNSEKVKGLTLKNAVNKIQVPEVISTGDKACYVKRAIPTAGALAEGQKIVGATLAWNQLVQNGNFASTSGWSARYGTISVSNNICTMTPSSDGTQRGLTGVSTSETLVANHKYLLSVSIKPPINSTVSISFEGTNAVNIPLTANTENKCNVIWTTTSNTTIKRFYALILETLTTSQSVEYANVNAIDLTQLFGSTIADAIYQMEQTTAGSGVSFFRKYFPEDYYAYDAGSLQSVNVSGHKISEKNYFDGSLYNGQIGSTGSYTSILTRITNAPQTQSNTLFLNRGTYTIDADGLDFITALTKNSEYNIVDNFAGSWNSLPFTFTLTADAYLYFSLRKSDNSQISPTDYEVMLAEGSTIEQTTYPLDSSKEFRGLYKLVNGELQADGDTYESDGTVTRKYGVVDLGSLNWDSVSNQRFASAEIRTNVKIPTNTSTAFNGVCAIFNTASNNDVYNHTNDRIIAVNGSGDVVIYYSQYESYTAAQVKTALNGIYLVYELATPTTETATPYTNPQLVDADGTEEFVDYKVSQGTRDVAIPVGHESSFYDYTDGSITIPDLPFADGTYALSVTMNNGTPTFSWESNS